MRPSPGVSISSASAATGSSPRTSGSPRTRVAKRPKRGSRGPSGPELRCAAAASGNSAPPGRSRLPVSTLSTSTSHDASVPNSCVQVPMRPYTAADGAAASSAARARMASAGTPQAGATLSGVKGRSACVSSGTPTTWSARCAARVTPRSSSSCATPASSSASVPGRTARCTSASLAVRDARGSTTTSRPPRRFSARRRPGRSGAVHSEPLDDIGSAPRTTSRSVRSTSGIGTLSLSPNSSTDDTCLGIWSAVDAEKIARVPSALSSAGT